MPTPLCPGDFDAAALFAVLDQQRIEQKLSWTGVAKAIWLQSDELNRRRGDHPISPATLRNVVEVQRDTTTSEPRSEAADPDAATDVIHPVDNGRGSGDCLGESLTIEARRGAG